MTCSRHTHPWTQNVNADSTTTTTRYTYTHTHIHTHTHTNTHIHTQSHKHTHTHTQICTMYACDGISFWCNSQTWGALYTSRRVHFVTMCSWNHAHQILLLCMTTNLIASVNIAINVMQSCEIKNIKCINRRQKLSIWLYEYDMCCTMKPV